MTIEEVNAIYKQDLSVTQMAERYTLTQLYDILAWVVYQPEGILPKRSYCMFLDKAIDIREKLYEPLVRTYEEYLLLNQQVWQAIEEENRKGRKG